MASRYTIVYHVQDNVYLSQIKASKDSWVKGFFVKDVTDDEIIKGFLDRGFILGIK